MKRYLIKAGFNSTFDLERAKKLLLKTGIKKSDIDYISNPRQSGKGLKFKRDHKGSILSLRFFVIGICLGVLAYLFSLFKTSDLDFWGTILSLNIASFLLTTFSFGVSCLTVGYIIGRRYTLHTVSFDTSDDTASNILMSVNVDRDKLEESQAILEKVESVYLEILDSKKEVEIGLRS